MVGVVVFVMVLEFVEVEWEEEVCCFCLFCDCFVVGV